MFACHRPGSGLALLAGWRYVARRPDIHRGRVTLPSAIRAHALLPLALFESLRALDAPPGEDLDEADRELAVRRLGSSRTVVAQIERYRRLASEGRRVDAEEAVAVLRLAGRRSDAALVFADAGRRAGRHAAREVAAPLRAAWLLVPRFARERLGFTLVRRAVHAALGAELSWDGGVPVMTIRDPIAVRATPSGAACGFYGSAVAELLRRFTAFDGAMLHEACGARGDRLCRWRASAQRRE